MMNGIVDDAMEFWNRDGFGRISPDRRHVQIQHDVHHEVAMTLPRCQRMGITVHRGEIVMISFDHDGRVDVETVHWLIQVTKPSAVLLIHLMCFECIRDRFTYYFQL